MVVELKALQDNRTWSIVPRPLNSHAIGCRWVYKIKLNENGTVERYKARLVAKGNNQVNISFAAHIRIYLFNAH
ncbi:Reverse transcriptase [Theobroma cacao]|nr:Reverse transcriptase [Theobroma cacao]